MTTFTPSARAREAASSLLTPICIQMTVGLGSSASASSTASPAACELRKISTKSIGPGTFESDLENMVVDALSGKVWIDPNHMIAMR
jgi:hypothetical protein